MNLEDTLRKFYLFLAVAVSLIFSMVWCPYPGHAGEEGTKLTTMDTIVVRAERQSEKLQTGDVHLDQIPSFYTVIEREAFEGTMTDLGQVIEKEAGIQVRQSGGFGSFSSVSLRGSTGEQVMIYLDGILLNDASGGGVDLSNISLSDVASIEIYKGSAPIQFGKASIGGVINIKTLRSKDSLSGNVSLGYGGFDTIKSTAFINYKKNDWDYVVSAEFLDSKNDFEFLNTNGTLWNPDDDKWENRENAQVRQLSLLGKVGHDFSSQTRLDFMNQWFQKEQGVASWNNRADNETTFDTMRNISSLKLTLDDLTRFHINTATRFDVAWMEEEYNDIKGQMGLGNPHTKNKTMKYGVNTYAEMLAKNQIITITADVHHETYSPEDLTGQKVGNDSNRTMFILGLEDTFMLMDERLKITPTMRMTHMDNKLKSETTATGFNLDEINSNDTYFNPQLGVKYQLFKWMNLKTNVASYVREPSFFELFGDRGFFIGNLELEPEEGLNWDVGSETMWKFGEGPVQALSFNLIYFQSDVDNLITRVYDARGIGKSKNISSSFISGVEFGMNVQFLKYFAFTGNVTLQDTENQSEIKAFDGKKLPGRFEKSYMARLEAARWNAKVYLEYFADKGLYYDTANLLEAEDKESIDVGISYLFSPSWQLTGEIKNIQDNHYEDFYRYPLPGRSFFASLKYMF